MSLEPRSLVERSSLQTFKDREDDTSQLNRLDGLLSYCFFPISALLLRLFVGAQLSASFVCSAQVLAAEETRFAPAQFLADG